MRFPTLLGVISCLLMVSCDPGDPRPTFCLLKTQTLDARCVETKEGGKDYDTSIFELDGWIATSQDDFAEMKKRYREIQEELRICRGN